MRKWQFSSLAFLAALLIGAALSLSAPVERTLAQADATPPPTEETPVEGAGEGTAQGLQLLWLQVDTGFLPYEIRDVTAGGPVDMYSILGGSCAQNTFAAPLPVFELHLHSDSPHIRLGFMTDDGSAVALALWDSIGNTWWCNTAANAAAELQFEPLIAGDYPVYVGVVGGARKVTGTVYITEAAAGAGTEATPEATAEATPGRRRGNQGN